LENQNIVQVENVSMCFNLYNERVDTLKEYVIRYIKGDLGRQEFWALKDINFNVLRGEAFGLVGVNGSGKSTLLKLIAKVMKPTRGSIGVTGSVSPLIELGAGFDTDLTARENVYLNGLVLGMTRKEIDYGFDEIVDFSELHDFLDIPIKNFSSGMLARLGFSVATARTPDLLIIDEVLSVGDFKFKEKCNDRINRMIANNTTVLLVSHNLKDIKEICNRAIWLDHGCIKMIDEANAVCDSYKG
jgi:ABC-type polysaccharide/polyol phosphate transport system, ATPase component